jgi:GTP-binding protein
MADSPNPSPAGDEASAEALRFQPPVIELPDGEALFRRPCTFVKGVVALAGLPEPTQPEVAFAGRSNVGKSSLINALVGRRDLARSSNTPGRTQELNFFDLGESIWLVDLPGYGFAKAPKAKVDAWNKLLQRYLSGRPNLQRTFILVDSRHGLKDLDREMMDRLDKAAQSFQVVLTKIDKIKASELDDLVQRCYAEVNKHVAAFPEILLTSSEKRIGIDRLRAHIAAMAEG